MDSEIWRAPGTGDEKLGKVMESDRLDEIADGNSTIRSPLDPTRALELIWGLFFCRTVRRYGTKFINSECLLTEGRGY